MTANCPFHKFSRETIRHLVSLLARGTPATSRAQIEQVVYHWKLLRLEFDSRKEMSSLHRVREKKHRLIGTCFCSFDLFKFIILINSFVAPDDDAIARLVAHFQEIIPKIADGSWQHFAQPKG